MMNPRIWLGIMVSIGVVAWLAYTLDPVHVWEALSGANPFLVLACWATLPVTMYLKCVRWRLFFPEPERISMRSLLAALYLGYMANTVLPLRAGEILRAFLVGEAERVNKSTVLATVLIEKVFDLGTVALFLFLLRFVIPLPDTANAAAWVSGLGLAVAAVGLGFALAARDRAIRLARWLEARLPLLGKIGASGLLASFLDGLGFVRKPVVLAKVLAWSVVMWLGSAVTVYLGLLALGIAQPFTVSLFVLVATNLSMAVPSAPGYVGVFHGVVVASLAVFGVDENQAAAAGIVLHAAIFGAFVVGGAYFLLRGDASAFGGRRLVDLVARARSSGHADQPAPVSLGDARREPAPREAL
ncbi:MAG: flippase-like domain-containing protein [Chloroflexota bacterium]|nr:flippase-like domain-containing protein [Chloroflexota bacterium]